MDTQGVPLGFEVYPGNTFEGKSLSGIVDKMRKKFNVRRFIFVADRGLFSRGNLRKLEEDQGEFIVGMKLGVFRKKHDIFYDLSRFTWLGEEWAIYETEHEGHRCMVMWSKSRAERDRKTREAVLDKLRKKLSKQRMSTQEFISHKGYKKYLNFNQDQQKPTLNEKAIEREAKKDGFFGVLTNVHDLSVRDVIAYYKELWKVEDAFGEIKGTLRARPVFHWTDQRITGHLVMCFLAYLCEAHLTKQLRDKKLTLESPAIKQRIIKPRALTVVEAMRELAQVRAIPIQIRGNTIWTRTDITGNATAIFRAAGVAIPPKVLAHHHTQNVVAHG